MVTMARRPLGAAAVAVVLMLVTASSCAARDFYVGGRDGWTPNPGEPHNRWAERNRFQVNDTLVFRYDEHADGVLLVNQGHYDACDTTEPYVRLDGGDSRFVLANSGPYFFISADAGRCKAGERLIVVVLAVRDNDFRNMPSPLFPSSPPPPLPKSASSSSPAPPLAQPKPAVSSSAPPPPPKSASSSAPPPKSASSSAQPPKSASSSAPPPKPASSSAPPPKPASSLAPPPPPPHVPSPTPPPPSPTSAGKVSSPSPAPVPGTNANCEPTAPSTSSAVALRVRVVACLLFAGGAALL